MGRKGLRSEKGVPETNWGQPKTKRFTVQLTEEGHKALKERAESLDVSMSEVFERWARGLPVDEYGKEKEELAPSPQALPAAPPLVKEGLAPSPQALPTDFPLDVETVLRSLTFLSRSQIGRIGLACLSLLMVNSPNSPNRDTIAQWVDDCREATLAVFSGVIKNAENRVNQIIAGAKPTKKELGLLVGVLPVSREEIMEMYSREFGGDESNRECTGDY